MEVDTELRAIQGALSALEPLDEAARSRAMDWIASALGVPRISPAHAGTGVLDSSSASPSVGEQSAKQFLASKKPRTAVERVACLAFFMTHGKQTHHFKTRDLSQLNIEAAGPPFSNIAQAAKDAVKAHYLASAGKQSRQITTLGEAVVEALPDRERVKAILAEERPVKRSRRRRSTSRPPQPGS